MTISKWLYLALAILCIAYIVYDAFLKQPPKPRRDISDNEDHIEWY